MMSKRRIRGFSRCQVPSFILRQGNPWLTLPSSCTSHIEARGCPFPVRLTQRDWEMGFAMGRARLHSAQSLQL